jgi:hypothetical protein
MERISIRHLSGARASQMEKEAAPEVELKPVEPKIIRQ